MNATAIVAVIGAVSTPLVAAAGFWFNDRRANHDRTAARQLAEDSQQHELALRREEQGHELDVRRRERAYEDRRASYRNALEWALVRVQQVELTDPIVRFTGMPTRPTICLRESSTGCRSKVAAFGSNEVLSGTFQDTVQEFQGRQMVVSTLRNQNVRGRSPSRRTPHATRHGTR